jgi:hypothetical protein
MDTELEDGRILKLTKRMTYFVEIIAKHIAVLQRKDANSLL